MHVVDVAGVDVFEAMSKRHGPGPLQCGRRRGLGPRELEIGMEGREMERRLRAERVEEPGAKAL
jgi:hypothetical protein